jgi:hypothetical protein
MTKKIEVICLMMLTISFFACTKEGKAPGPGTSPQQGENAAHTSSEIGRKSTGSTMVGIMPGTPTVMTDIQVVYSGPGPAAYQWKRNSLVIPGQTTYKLLKKYFLRGDTITVIVTSGGVEESASVVIGNSAPNVVSVPFSPEYIHAGVDITVKPVVFDADGDEVGFRYAWSINGRELLEDSPVLSGNNFKKGDTVLLKVIPYDRGGEGAPYLTKGMIIPNASPRIISVPIEEFLGSEYTYRVVAEDPDGDPLIYSFASAPQGMTIDAKTGVITWRIDDKPQGVYAVEIVAQDPDGVKATQKYTLSVTHTEGGRK